MKKRARNLEIKKYLEVLEEGRMDILEELAVRAGYTEEYKGYENFTERKSELQKAVAEFEKGENRAGAIKQLVLAMENFYEKTTVEKGQFCHLLKDKCGEKGDAEAMIWWVEKMLLMDDNIWQGKKDGFIRIKKGPAPFKYSLAAYFYWEKENNIFKCDVFDDGGLMRRSCPQGAILFVDEFSHNPLFEKIKIGFWNAFSSNYKDEKLPQTDSSEYDEGMRKFYEGVIITRKVSNSIKFSQGMENLIFGERAIKYLIGCLNAKKASFCIPPSQYAKLIKAEREKIKFLRENERDKKVLKREEEIVRDAIKALKNRHRRFYQE